MDIGGWREEVEIDVQREEVEIGGRREYAKNFMLADIDGASLYKSCIELC